MINPTYTIINKQTGRFPFVAKDRYCESKEPRTSMFYLTPADARKDISTVALEAKKLERAYAEIARDYRADARRQKNATSKKQIEGYAKSYDKLLRKLKKRDYAVVKLTMEYIN